MESPIDRTQTSPIEASSQSAPNLGPNNFIQPQKTVSKNYGKIATGFLGLVAVIGVLAFGYVTKRSMTENATIATIQTVQPSAPSTLPSSTVITQTGPTANWKTYKNDKYNFQMQYPTSLNQDSISGSTVDYGRQFKTDFMRVNDPAHSNTILLVWVALDKNSFNPAFGLEGQTKISSTPVKVDNYDALLETWRTDTKPHQQGFIQSYSPGDPILTDYIVTLKDKPLLILYRNDVEKNNVSLNQLKQILSSFKFTDKIQINSFTNWKTYTSKKDSYSLKYPSVWNVEENVNDLGPIFPNYTFIFKAKNEFDPGVMIWMTSQTTPEKWIGKQASGNMPFNKSVIVDGIPGTLVDSIPGVSNQKWVFVNKNKKTYILFASGPNDELQIFDQILSTFQFK